MHYAHFILVDVEELKEKEYKELNLQDLKEKVREYAEKATEDFHNHVFDWRETRTAGNWSNEFPDNVILGNQQSDKIREILNTVRTCQKEEIDSYVSILKEYGWIQEDGTIKVTLGKLKDLAEEKSNYEYYLPFYYFWKLVSYLRREYMCNSFFYDTKTGSGYLSQHIYDKVYNNPERYAFVVFDYHY
ncbi:hypothetical protein Calkr_2071 [Caldicellulosiruptor acetigenus I77R1B]|uniref:Uncharacterized protein n=1 Tax=Caldicellulosiruptor acetigenus (strain ATCC 700853 / DSM 12137 / I77R1B) TaxID=632335 RepID=E4S5A6_CALA7|nr:hypothetical protein [Caldicellulosiruptor acetigenus]ADQ41540.1 hypothetical protein Calkr_2071 [Caldicellulosiruptor acetigenus I77R1B]